MILRKPCEAGCLYCTYAVTANVDIVQHFVIYMLYTTTTQFVFRFFEGVCVCVCLRSIDKRLFTSFFIGRVLCSGVNYITRLELISGSFAVDSGLCWIHSWLGLCHTHVHNKCQ